MGTVARVRVVTAILVIGALASPVLANDAGSGGDAGDTFSTAVPLNATDATYYGNLSSTDTSDFYSFTMPNATGIAIGLTSPSTGDFDPYLYDSSETQIDYSFTVATYEEVSSNGTNVGGTTVYYEVRQWSGSGQYMLQVWIFSTANQPGNNQNDANSGTDAGGSAGNSLQLNSTNQTISGWISDTWDSEDWYNISVPTGHGIAVTMDFPNGTTFDYLYLYDSSGTQYIDYAYQSPWEVTSNGTGVGGSYVYVNVYSYYSEGDYNLTFTYFSTAGQPGSVQDDAGSGTDAGDTLAAALNLSVPTSGANYSGWVDYTWDANDYYAVDVPTNWTTWASMDWNSSADLLDLFLYDSSGTQIDYSLFENPEEVTGNGSAVSGTTVYYRVQAWTSGAASIDYTLTINFANLSDTPAFNQNDANSGGDAGNDFPDALNLSGNGTYFGWISETADTLDVYAVQVPPFYAIEASLSWNNSANDYALGLFDEGQNQIDSSFFANPQTVESGTTNVSNTTVFVVVQAGVGEGNYTLEISLVNQSSVPGLNQDDAYSGDDAGDTFADATTINATPSLSYWPGYADDSDDQYDYYSLYVPADHGITVEMTYQSINWFNLVLYDSSQSQVNYSYYYNPQVVSTNNTGSYLGGTDVYIEVWAYSGDGTYNLTVWLFPLDADGDGFYDEDEAACGSDPNDNSSVPLDTDADGVCDGLDGDIDGDGVDNANDSFPEDANETTDTDGDGTGDNADGDDDGDGFYDGVEEDCLSDPMDASSVPTDTDEDGVCDEMDDDMDGDGTPNDSDSFPLDPGEWNDTDGDNIGDNTDPDDDNDGYGDDVEEDCLSDPMDASSVPTDTDEDGVCDEMDDDVDGDGTPNDLDSSPLDPTEDTDTDGDNIGDNTDPDDDNDGYADDVDAFPLDVSEWEDNDNDGLGDNADIDDDNDGWTDSEEADCMTNPLSELFTPSDSDQDHLCDLVDEDDDNDGTPDVADAFQYDPTEASDLDQDGIGDNADLDDDGDGWADLDEISICGTDPMDVNSVPDDFDRDTLCDPLDEDDDNDMVLDADDRFPYDPSETKDTDNDGIGDGDDTDDDGDGWADSTEMVCATSPLDGSEYPPDADGDGSCDLVDPDDDNDGWTDEEDAFPFDTTEWVDRNGDGRGDNAHPLTTMDHMRLNPEATVVGFAVTCALASASIAFAIGSRGRFPEDFSEDDMTEFDPYDEY
ncbi:MAG: hypothetical protein QGG21_01555 [Candidatus Thalassarchaeaceae archaeon]|jgi:hypothetical protein|nr:hypothetical protein [Candidatus Thalassarchaeaceae archaeon]